MQNIKIPEQGIYLNSAEEKHVSVCQQLYDNQELQHTLKYIRLTTKRYWCMDFLKSVFIFNYQQFHLWAIKAHHLWFKVMCRNYGGQRFGFILNHHTFDFICRLENLGTYTFHTASFYSENLNENVIMALRKLYKVQ